MLQVDVWSEILASTMMLPLYLYSPCFKSPQPPPHVSKANMLYLPHNIFILSLSEHLTGVKNLLHQFFCDEDKRDIKIEDPRETTDFFLMENKKNVAENAFLLSFCKHFVIGLFLPNTKSYC